MTTDTDESREIERLDAEVTRLTASLAATERLACVLHFLVNGAECQFTQAIEHSVSQLIGTDPQPGCLAEVRRLAALEGEKAS